MPKATHTMHGINFIRTGTCTQCGGCDHECSVCPHGVLIDKKWSCAIYATRSEVCAKCTDDVGGVWYRQGEKVTHQLCVDFQTHPFIYVIYKGLCGYVFTPDKMVDIAKISGLEVRYDNTITP